jgi:type I restriction enzyme S subunit
MSSEWRDTTWGEIASLEYGKAIRDYQNASGTIPVYGTNGPIGWHHTPLCPSAGVIIGRKGAYRGIHYSNTAFFVIDTAFYLKPKERIDTKWAYYCLLTYDINGMDSGSAIPSTSRDEFYKLHLRIPGFGEQQRIAKFLSMFDDRIALLRETNATLEAIAQALFKSWFVDFDPVHAKQQGRAPEGMDEATAALFPDSFEESELGVVPRGWQVGLLGAWLSVLETGRRPKGGVSGIDSGVPSIGAESIIRVGEFDFAKTKYVSDEFFDKMKAGRLESRDVLLYKDGGKPGVFLPRVSMFGDGFPYEICGINEHVFRIRLKEPFGQTFLYFWLWSDAIMHELKHRGGKAAIPGINQADVKEQRLLIPNDLVLRQFDELTYPLISRVFGNAKQIQTLATLRDTLLPRLISGQLLLPDAEELVEDLL